MPTGNAIDIPAMSMAITIRMLAKLKITPPISARGMEFPSAWARSVKKPLPSVPEAPRVIPNKKVRSTMPRA